MKNKILIGVSIIALSLSFFAFLLLNKPADEAKAGTITKIVDFLGTGTSTAGTVNFNTTAATNTPSVVILGDNTDTVDLEFYPESASSTAHVSVQVLTSSLNRCATSGANNQDWVDALSFTTTASGVSTVTSATSTVSWIPVTSSDKGMKYQITNVNAYCMKIYVGAKSVNLYGRAILKSLSF